MKTPVKFNFTKMEIPVEVIKKYSMILKAQNQKIIDKFLHAVGLQVYNQVCNVNWETFIKLNCLLKLNTASKKEYIDFFVGVFDPYKIGVMTKNEYEGVIDEFFSD